MVYDGSNISMILWMVYAVSYRLFWMETAIICFAASCGTTSYSHEKNIVWAGGKGSAYMAYDVTTLQGTVNFSDVIIVGEISEIKNIKYDESSDTPLFEYTIAVKEIVFDRKDKLIQGSELTLLANNGYIKATEYKKAVGNTLKSQKFGHVNADFEDEDYFAFSDFGSIYLDIGKEYLLFLNDGEYDRNDGAYIISSEYFMYELANNNIYEGADFSRVDKSYTRLTNEITLAIENRSDELDYGTLHYFDNYLKEQID